MNWVNMDIVPFGAKGNRVNSMIRLNGELKKRITKNRVRLSEPQYSAPAIFSEGGEWPGDWQGRTMLALAYHCAVCEKDEFEKTFRQLKEIVSALDDYTNEDGYFGERFNGVYVNEQQISGNSWFLRGLCEYYKLSSDANILNRLDRISETYLSRLKDFYSNYPKVKRENGAVDGHLQKQIVNGWLLSSDVGCAFIMLDGITQVYEITKNVMLLPVIEEMLNKFADIDYVQYNCQTHAVLSGTRGVLRFYRLTKNERWLRLAVRNFEIYLNYGTTINYANFNWFGKPSWTEPCAIIDSLIAAQELFRFTGERKYLEFMNRCYFNALRFSQRPNGGAGCDTCLNEQNNRLVIYMYEAYFCCSMRIAEGLCDLALNGCIAYENVIYIPLLVGFENDLLSLQVEECEDKIILHMYVKNECSMIKIYLPEYAEVQSDKNYEISEGFVCLENCKGQYDILFSLKDHISERMGRELHMRGDWILFRKENNMQASYERLVNCIEIPDQNAVLKTELYL